MLIEVRDARMPITSHNPELIQMFPPNMKRLIVFNKMDLANEKKTLAIIRAIQEQNTKVPTIHVSTKENVNVNKML